MIQTERRALQIAIAERRDPSVCSDFAGRRVKYVEPKTDVAPLKCRTTKARQDGVIQAEIVHCQWRYAAVAWPFHHLTTD